LAIVVLLVVEPVGPLEGGYLANRLETAQAAAIRLLPS
jgi:hypothetical protein